MVVHFLEDEDLSVAQVARHEEGHDLPAAILQDLVAAGEAGEDQVAAWGGIVFAQDVLACAVTTLVLAGEVRSATRLS
jgi:hypothetical protein